MGRANPIIVAHHGSKYVVRQGKQHIVFDHRKPGQVEGHYIYKKDAVNHIKQTDGSEEDGSTGRRIDTVD